MWKGCGERERIEIRGNSTVIDGKVIGDFFFSVSLYFPVFFNFLYLLKKFTKN